MFVTVMLQFATSAPLQWPGDCWVGGVLVVPAAIDWAIGRFRPLWFSNGWRTFTGALLGLGLGRSVYIHVQRPFPSVLQAQLGFISAVALTVVLVSVVRHRLRRLSRSSELQEQRLHRDSGHRP
jgi:hypothetical protein